MGGSGPGHDKIQQKPYWTKAGAGAACTSYVSTTHLSSIMNHTLRTATLILTPALALAFASCEKKTETEVKIDKAVEATKDAAAATGEAAKKAAETTVNKVEAAADKAATETKNALEKAADAAAKATETAKEKVSDALDTAKDAAESAAEKVEDAANTGLQKAAEGVESAAEKVEEAVKEQ
jgi:hypothetical protein